MLVNYASNMIRIILNNCTIFWKQREFLHGLDNLRDRKAVLLRKWIALILPFSKISFHGLPSKGKRPSIRKQIASPLCHSIFNSNIVFTKQPSAERYLEKKFRQYFYKLLGNSCSASKKRYLEIFRKFAENTRGEFYFSKVTGFYRSSQRRCSVKKGDLRKVFAKFTGKHLWQRLYFNKIAGLRL